MVRGPDQTTRGAPEAPRNGRLERWLVRQPDHAPAPRRARAAPTTRPRRADHAPAPTTRPRRADWSSRRTNERSGPVERAEFGCFVRHMVRGPDQTTRGAPEAPRNGRLERCLVRQPDHASTRTRGVGPRDHADTRRRATRLARRRATRLARRQAQPGLNRGG